MVRVGWDLLSNNLASAWGATRRIGFSCTHTRTHTEEIRRRKSKDPMLNQFDVTTRRQHCCLARRADATREERERAVG